MAQRDFTIDHGGARGSNAGDEYHELWAVRQALGLLDLDTDFLGLTVEGIPAADGEDAVWEGVDCGLLFGGYSLAEATRVEWQQLKYSSASPDAPWTVARFASGKDGKTSNSPLRRLAAAYEKTLHQRTTPLQSIKLSLVTNQPIAEALTQAIEAAREGVPNEYGSPWTTGAPDLHRLVHASGLAPEEFKQFALALDLQGSSGSRFASQEALLQAIAQWSDVEFIEVARNLREYIRARMKPETAGDVVTKEKVLFQFKVSDERALFPCPNDIKTTINPVLRTTPSEIVAKMLAGEQYICMHGLGGVGKTTALQQIREELPTGSLSIVFDCYGGGSYQDASTLRHKPDDAFLQLCNEIALALHAPLLLEPRSTRQYARAFRKRLDEAAALLGAIRPDALLLVAIDAADNSVTAAKERTPPEPTFVHDFVTIANLPANVRFLVSTRTGRKGDLKLPRHYKQVPLPPFIESETRANVTRYWDAPTEWVEDFHHLSNGIPRVQTYAFDTTPAAPIHAVDALRPAGKALHQVFEEQFNLALSKAGGANDLQRVCAGLTVLSRPIPVTELTVVLDLDSTQVEDICADLAPGVRNNSGFLSFADEDFEAFVREEAASRLDEVRQRTADRFLARAHQDEYAALNVASALLAADRRAALLDFVEQQPEPDASVVRDPVRRQEIRLQRLITAIKACRDSGDPARALRFVLIGAEAMGTESATRALLGSFPRLTARYARETAGRLILGDPDRVSDHGALLFELLTVDAAKGDAIGYREGRRRLSAWQEARVEAAEEQQARGWNAQDWEIDGEQGAAFAYGILRMHGAETCAKRLLGFRPASFALDSGRILLERLLAERRFEDIQQIANALPTAWALFPLVALCTVGQPVDLKRMATSLGLCHRRLKISPAELGYASDEEALTPFVVDTALTATEILAAHGSNTGLVQQVLAAFTDSEVRRVDKVSEHQPNHIDAILRAYCLSTLLLDQPIALNEALTPRAPPAEGKQSGGRRSEEDRNLTELVSAIGEYYSARAAVILASPEARQSTFAERFPAARTTFAKDAWRFDRRHTSSAVRIRIANSLLLFIGLGVEPDLVLEHILEVRQGVWSGISARTGSVFRRLPAVARLHSKLVDVLLNAARETRRERSGAEDKSRTLSGYATLLIPLSTHDADAVFQQAIEVASELDSEAVDQLKFMAKLVEHGATSFGARRRETTQQLAEIAQDAGIRLQNVEHFPWNEVCGALAQLDLPVALAAASRWDDTGALSLSYSLPPVVAAALRQALISEGQAAALLGLLERPDTSDLAPLLSSDDERLCEEVSRDLIGDRIGQSERVLAFVERRGRGPWATAVRDEVKFASTLNGQDQPSTNDAQSRQASSSNSTLGSFIWDENALTTVEGLELAIDAIRTAERLAGGFMDIEGVLKHARDAVPVSARIPHLRAIVQYLQKEQTGSVAGSLLSALDNWKEQDAVKQWAAAEIPVVVVDQLSLLARYLNWDDGLLRRALAASLASPASIQAMLLEGLERDAENLGSSTTFALAGEIARHCTQLEAATLCQWYANRLLTRIDAEDLEQISAEHLPAEPSVAVARVFWSALGDIDLRQRWRAAHAIRRLARLGEIEQVEKIFAQRSRETELAFRDPAAPFYWIAAKLWFVIALDRIATESPTVAERFAPWLFEVATDEAFPHLLLRDYAASAVRKLLASKQIKLAPDRLDALKRVNQSPLPRGRKKPGYGRSYDGLRRSDPEPPRRFHFNHLDTLRYWYERWLRAFEDLGTEEFLQQAEHWIVDQWGVKDEEPYGFKEPRNGRINDRNWQLSHNSHGSLPTIEPYRSHLEWHAMWCAAGQVLKSHRITKPSYPGDNDVDQQIGYNRPSDRDLWLADLAGPKPREAHFWKPQPPDEDWLRSVPDEHFLREALPPTRPGYVTVDAYVVTKWGEKEDNIRVRSALVSPATAPALVRALQTMDDPFNFYFCPEDHESEIDEQDYQLLGWLQHKDADSGFDSEDVFSNGIRRIDPIPGKRIRKHFRYRRVVAPGQVEWFHGRETTPAFIHCAWAPREREDNRYYGKDADSRGERLLVRADHLAEFLRTENFDLLIEVGVSRRDEKRQREDADYEESAGPAEFDRVFHFCGDGSVRAAERDFGAWFPDRPRT